MKSFPDTSFLCSVYRTQTHSRKADTFMAKLVGPLPVSTFLLLELRQSLRLQARVNAQDKTKGFPKREAALDGGRLLQWIVAYAGLGAAWSLESGHDPAPGLAIAEEAAAELG